MRRREFLGLVGGGVAWPAVARAQQQTVPTIGFLSSRSPKDSKPHLEGFLRGLGAFGYVDGKTAKIEYRWANGQYDQLRKLAGELAALQPAIIAAAGGAPSARAAKSVTASIPIVFVAGDSVSEGIVASLNQPGANVTGVDLMSGELTGKRLGLLVQLLPPGTPVGFLTNKKGVQSSLRANDFELAVAAMGRELVVVGSQRRHANRQQFLYTHSETSWRAGRRKRSLFRLPAHAPYSIDSAALDSGDLSYSRIPAGRRSDELRDEPGGRVQSNGRPGRAHPQRREHRRPPGHTPNEIRTGSKSGHSKSAGAHRPDDSFGDR